MRRMSCAVGLCLAVVFSSIGVLVAPPPSSAASAPTVPGVASAVASDEAAIVSWGPPVSDGGSPIVGWVVTPYNGEVAEPAQTFTSPALTQTLTVLSNGGYYRFRVAAINAEGTGPASGLPGPFSGVTVGAPRVPTNVTPVAGPQSALVSWTPPVDNGSPITGYTIAIIQPGGSPLFARTVSVPGAVDQATVPVPVNTSREFIVRAVNDRGAGIGARSNPVTGLPSPPAAPSAVSAVAGVQTANVTWTRPAADGGSPILGYVITPSRDGVTQDPVTFASTSFSQTLDGLAAGSYTFTVAAYNVAGTGPPSAPSDPVQVTTGAMPGPPGQARATPGNGAAVVTWGLPASDGGSPITGYVVTPYLNEVAQPTQTFMSTARTQTVTGLVNGGYYVFRVSAINANGIGLQSPPQGVFFGIFVGTPVSPPSVAVSAGLVSAQVSWTVPVDNGSFITGYRIAIATPGQSGLNSRFVEVGPEVTSVTVGDLTPYVSHTITVAARNARGLGPGRTAPPVVPLANPPGPPGSVTAIEGVESATVSWALPTTNGGLAIVGYDLTPYRDGVAMATRSLSSLSRTQIISDLPAGVYTFTVAARNGVGTGPHSAPSAPVAVPGVGTPTQPGVAVAMPGDGSAVVTWQAPASDQGSPILGYVVVPFNGNVAEAPQTFMSTSRTQTLTGLVNGGYYRFRVAAINEVGFGQLSAMPNPFFGVTVGTPLAPTSFSASATEATGEAALSWGPPATDNGSPVTAYNIKVTESGQSLINARTVVVGGGATSTTIDGLSSGVAYTFTVNAVNARGIGRPATRGPVTPS